MVVARRAARRERGEWRLRVVQKRVVQPAAQQKAEPRTAERPRPAGIVLHRREVLKASPQAAHPRKAERQKAVPGKAERPRPAATVLHHLEVLQAHSEVEHPEKAERPKVPRAKAPRVKAVVLAPVACLAALLEVFPPAVAVRRPAVAASVPCAAEVAREAWRLVAARRILARVAVARMEEPAAPDATAAQLKAAAPVSAPRPVAQNAAAVAVVPAGEVAPLRGVVVAAVSAEAEVPRPVEEVAPAEAELLPAGVAVRAEVAEVARPLAARGALAALRQVARVGRGVLWAFRPDPLLLSPEPRQMARPALAMARPSTA
jgi:hypothetical protein